jgi:phospholipid transport system substrate-binding protein
VIALALTSMLFAAPAAGSASAAVQTAQDRLRVALDGWFKAQGPARDAARSKARAAVSDLIDFDAFAKETLGGEWNKLKAPDRARYTAALKGAMEANYLHKMRQGQSSDVAKVKSEVASEAKQGERTLVKTHVKSGEDSIDLDYLMERGKKGWHAVDVLTDGVSTSDTYRELVARQLPKNGIEGVISFFEKKKKSIEASEDAKTADAKAPDGKPEGAAVANTPSAPVPPGKQ